MRIQAPSPELDLHPAGSNRPGQAGIDRVWGRPASDTAHVTVRLASADDQAAACVPFYSMINRIRIAVVLSATRIFE